MNEKTFATIRKNPIEKYGIELAIGDKTFPITQKTTDGFYHLPENPIRKYIMVDLVDYHLKDKDSFILNVENSNPKNFGIKNSVEKTKYEKGQSIRLKKDKLSLESCEEFLQTDEEKETWNNIMGVIRERYEEKLRIQEEEHKKNSGIEKAKSALQKQLEILKAAGIDVSALLK